MKAFARYRKVLQSMFLLLLLCCAYGELAAQCSGFPATTADADCAGGTTLTNNANINSGQTYGFCGPNNTTYSYSGINLAGGTLRICGNANITGNFNSGIIVVSCGATVNFTSGLTLNSSVGIINYGTINITGDLTFQNSNNYVYNESATSTLKVSGNISYPLNNGQNAYLKNSGYIKVSGNFNAYEGGFTCFMSGGLMEVANLNYFNNCSASGNRFSFGSSSGSAIIRYTGTATLKAPFTATSFWKVYQATGSTASLSCNGSWGSAVLTANAAALTAPGAQSCTSVSTCWRTLASTGLSLGGRLDGSRVELDWSTLTESNTDYFEVQRSSNGVSWERLVTLQAAGNSTAATYYKTYDNRPGEGLRYYRVILTSLDGMATYSQIIAIRGGSVVSPLAVYPNPGNGSQIRLTGWNDAAVHPFSIYNALGQRVHAGTAQNAVLVQIPRLSKGIYFIVADAGDARRRVTYVQE